MDGDGSISFDFKSTRPSGHEAALLYYTALISMTGTESV
jgi:hypothetical protein